MSQVEEVPLASAPPSPTKSKIAPWSVLLAGVVALAYAPMLLLHGQGMWPREHYGYIVLVPIGALALALSRLGDTTDIFSFLAESSWPFRIVTGGGVFAYALALFAAEDPSLSQKLSPAWLGGAGWLMIFVGCAIGVASAVRTELEINPAAGTGRREPGAAIAAFALLMQAFAVAVFSPLASMVSFMFVLLGGLWAIGGPKIVVRLLPVWLLLWLMIPLPFNLDIKLVTSLQTLTAEWGSRLLDFFHVMHLRDGNYFSIDSKDPELAELFVEEGCSGVRSLFAAVAVVVFYVLWMGHPVVRAVLLVACSVGWVLVANALRVVTITICASFGHNLTKGFSHTMLGVAIFVVTMALVLSTDRLLMFFMPPRGRRWQDDQPAADLDVPLPNGQRGAFGIWAPLGVCYMLLILGQAYLLWPSQAVAAAASAEQEIEQRAFANPPTPPVEANWIAREAASTSRPRFDAKKSWYWPFEMRTSREQAASAIAAVDFPFSDWHDLRVCYRGTGWTEDGETVYHDAESPDDIPYVEVHWKKSETDYGYLLFYLFDQQGNPLERRTYTVGENFMSRVSKIGENWRAAGQQMATGNRPEHLQVQLFIDSRAPLNEKEIAAAHQCYADMVRKLRTKWCVAANP